jgi:transglutaminase-like putative cysteine protease
MRIRIGYDLTYRHIQDTPIIAMLEVHPFRRNDLERLDFPVMEPNLPIDRFLDGFGNQCCRFVAPPGDLRISCETVVRDSGQPDEVAPHAIQHRVQDLPYDTLGYLLGSRYCETQLLTDDAWRLFGQTPLGWARVQAVCDFVHEHLRFDYKLASPTRTVAEAYRDRIAVCRDFAHLAITLCRCLNIPARYCTGYMGDIGVPPSPDPMDFSGWFEAYLGHRWYTFDARSNKPRIGRVPIAYGQDAGDVAITTTFGPNVLANFRVISDELL